MSTATAELQTATLPRLLLGISSQGHMSLHRHMAIHGPLPAPLQGRRRRSRREHPPLIEELQHAGLRGRGGAGFPTATKLRAVAGAKGKPIVIINAAEGEPASLKDRTLLQAAPHLVLDGGALAASAVGSDQLILCVCETASAAIFSATQAIEERAGLTGDPSSVTLLTVPGGYISGQESALVNHLGGGPAKPMYTPPMLYERGLSRRPTLVNNPETLAQLALIARHGSDWFRELGAPSQPGSGLLTLHGPVAHQGVYEIEYGSSLTSLLDAAGGTTAQIRALLFGGYSGSWVDGEALHSLRLADEELDPYGASLGAGVVLALEQGACGVCEVAHVTRWMADESSGQCGPCVHGLHAIACTLEEIASGLAGSRPLQRIDELSALVGGRGACRHPDGVLRFVQSGLEVFGEEFASHAQNGPCRACARPRRLPLGAGERSRMGSVAR